MASNAVVTTQWIVNSIADAFLERVILAEKCDRTYDPQFKGKGATAGPKGSVVQARLPQRPRAASGALLNKQPIIDQTFEVRITDQTNIGIELSTYTLTLEKDQIMKTCIIPAANALVQDMESKGFQRLYKKVPNSIGTPGTSPTANLTYTQGVAKLKDMIGQTDDLIAILSNDQSAVIADAQKGNANPGFGAPSALRKGQFLGPNMLGIAEWYASANVAGHTTGAATTATPLVNVAGGYLTEGGTTIVTDGWGSAVLALREGDTFTLGGAFEINASNFASTGRLRQFTLTSDVTPDGSGNATLSFFPAIYASTSSPYQNVTALPADNAVITYWAMAAGGSQAATPSRQGLIFAPGTFILAMADAEKVDAPVCVFAQDEEAGISMRLTKSYDINNDNNLARLDMFWGFSAQRPEWQALRVQGA